MFDGVQDKESLQKLCNISSEIKNYNGIFTLRQAGMTTEAIEEAPTQTKVNFVGVEDNLIHETIYLVSDKFAGSMGMVNMILHRCMNL